MTIYTFDNFWTRYHYVTKQPKLDKTISKRLWDSTISLDIKKRSFDNIHKNIKVSAYRYLLKELRQY